MCVCVCVFVCMCECLGCVRFSVYVGVCFGATVCVCDICVFMCVCIYLVETEDDEQWTHSVHGEAGHLV